MILDIGITRVDASLSWETLYSYNRKFLDPVANRYFFVANPVRLLVHAAPKITEARLRLHPGRPEAGERVLPLGNEEGSLVFQISRNDVRGLKVGDNFRLKDLMNVELKKEEAVMEAEFSGLEVKDVPKIQWVSAGAVQLEVIEPDATMGTGLAEPPVGSLKVDDVVQLERYGFVRIDSVRPKLVAVYSHR